MSDFLAETIRAIRADIEDVKRRVASVVMIGQVKQTSGDKLRLEFDEKDASTGKPFQSPLVRRANSAGVNGNGHKERNRPVVGETMALISPNGEIGKHSRAIPYGPTDESAEPAGDEGFARVFSDGNASIAIKDGEIRLKVGDQGFSLTADGLQMLGKFKGKNGTRPAHYKTGVDSAGDIAISGNDDVLI